MKSFLIAAIAALTLSPALAHDKTVTVTGYAPMGAGGYQTLAVKVVYNDLDITTTQGAIALQERIALAARLACGERLSPPRNHERRDVLKACQEQAVAKAVKTVGQPALTRVAAGQ